MSSFLEVKKGRTIGDVMEGFKMNEELGFLFDKVERYDFVFVEVVGAPRPQTLRAKVERIYTSNKGVDDASLGSEIEFVRSGGLGVM